MVIDTDLNGKVHSSNRDALNGKAHSANQDSSPVSFDDVKTNQVV